MATEVSNVLTREQKAHFLQVHVGQSVLDSLGGPENVLKTIPQNNKFAHPWHLTQLSKWAETLSYLKINPTADTEISISEDFVIFVLRRPVESVEKAKMVTLAVLYLKCISCDTFSFFNPAKKRPRETCREILITPQIGEVIQKPELPLSAFLFSKPKKEEPHTSVVETYNLLRSFARPPCAMQEPMD